MSKITNDGSTRSGTGCCFIAVYQYGNSGRQRVNLQSTSRLTVVPVSCIVFRPRLLRHSAPRYIGSGHPPTTKMVLNAAARLVVGLGKYQHITPVLRDVLHWLPVPQRIQIKIATLTFDCVRGARPAYSSCIACTVADNSGRPGLRSAELGDLLVPRTRTTRLRRRSFFIATPVVWNSMPFHLRSPSISFEQC